MLSIDSQSIRLCAELEWDVCAFCPRFRLRLASYFSSVAPGNIGRMPTQDWPSRMTGSKKNSGVSFNIFVMAPAAVLTGHCSVLCKQLVPAGAVQAVNSNALASPQRQKSISAFLATSNHRTDMRPSSHQAGAHLPQQVQSGRERSWHAVTDADVNKLWPTEWPATGRISTHTSHDRCFTSYPIFVYAIRSQSGRSSAQFVTPWLIMYL